jgi:cystathionine gamma-synthase
MSTFSHLPVGQPIPASPHAVSCSLPTMRDVRGYEERDAEIMRHVTTGYPRFVVHAFVRQLAEGFTRDMRELAGRTLWLTSSGRMAAELCAHLGTAGGAQPFARNGVHGASHLESAETHARAKMFLQNVGGFLSSREAEDHLVRLGRLPAAAPEPTFAGDAPAEIRRLLRGVLPATEDRDLLLANTGMNAIYAAFRSCCKVQAPRGRTIWLQPGWLYLDTITILKCFTPTPEDYIHVVDPLDLPSLERVFAQHGSQIAGVFAEVPTNPLLETTDVPALAALCRRHGAHLLLDPSTSSIFDLDVLQFADAVVASLTKYTASEGDVIAGLVAVNPQRPDADALRKHTASRLEPVYSRDLARLAAQIGETDSVLARIHANTAKVAAFLARHPAVREVFWAFHPASATNYRRIARRPDATGGMITFTLRGPMQPFYDRLRLAKGPSFGMKTTLICPFMYFAHYELVNTPAGVATLRANRLDPDLLRLCCGTEPADDIIEALADAMDAGRSR